MNPPFTLEQFLGVFGRYNQAVGLMTWVLYYLAALLVVKMLRRSGATGQWITYALAFLWAWMGIVYHWAFFTSINSAAYLFGALFLLQAAALLYAGHRHPSLHFKATNTVSGIVGGGMMVYALIIYPILGGLAGHEYPRGPIFGLPCPTTIFTFGVLLWSDRRVPVWLLVIPAAWSVLGTSAAVSFGIVEDFGLIFAGILGTTMILWRNHRLPEATSPKAHSVGTLPGLGTS
jgi:hypothetical protein